MALEIAKQAAAAQEVQAKLAKMQRQRQDAQAIGALAGLAILGGAAVGHQINNNLR